MQISFANQCCQKIDIINSHEYCIIHAIINWYKIKQINTSNYTQIILQHHRRVKLNRSSSSFSLLSSKVILRPPAEVFPSGTNGVLSPIKTFNYFQLTKCDYGHGKYSTDRAQPLITPQMVFRVSTSSVGLLWVLNNEFVAFN